MAKPKVAKNESEGKDVIIVKVGQEPVSQSEVMGRYKKANHQLKRKVEKLVLEKARMQLEIKELELKTYLTTDEATEKIIDGLRKQTKVDKINLDRTSEERQELLSKYRDESSAGNALGVEIKKLNKDIAAGKEENEELQLKIIELNEEIKAWQDEDDRFSNMDLS